MLAGAVPAGISVDVNGIVKKGRRRPLHVFRDEMVCQRFDLLMQASRDDVTACRFFQKVRREMRQLWGVYATRVNICATTYLRSVCQSKRVPRAILVVIGQMTNIYCQICHFDTIGEKVTRFCICRVVCACM